MNNATILWAADALTASPALAGVAEHTLDLCMAEMRSQGATEDDIEHHLERLFTPRPRRVQTVFKFNASRSCELVR